MRFASLALAPVLSLLAGAACSPARSPQDAPAVADPSTASTAPTDAPRDRVCARFVSAAVDFGRSDVTAFALTTTVTCVVSRGELSCVDLFGSAPHVFATKIVALAGGARIVALTDDGSIVASQAPGSGEERLGLAAFRKDVAQWGRKPVSLTQFDDRLTLFDDRGEQRRFRLLRGGSDETVVATPAAFPEPARRATVSHSSFFDEYECALVGAEERCRRKHGSWETVRHAGPVRTIGANCAVLEDDGISCFGKSTDTPQRIGRVAGAVAVSTSDVATGACAIDGAGHVVCLGDLGIGFTTRGFAPSAEPRVVAGIDGAIALEVMDGRACALGKDGRLRCFGCVQAHDAMRQLATPRFPTMSERR